MDALAMIKDPTGDLFADLLLIDKPATTPPKPIGKPTKQVKVKKQVKDVDGRFKVTDKGVFQVTPSTDADGGKRFEFVCGKLDIVAMIRDQHSGQWGKLLQWQDPDGHFHEWAMPMSALQGDGNEVRRELAAGGLEISQTLKLRNALIGYLSETKTSHRARGVEQTGWHHSKDGEVFVLPDRSVGESSEVVRFQSDAGNSTYSTAGTADGWRNGVAALCAGNSRCVLSVCTGFASMLLKFSGLESGGLNIKGSSSTGKSTALLASASIFGGLDYVNRWRATSNGLEAIAASHNDTLLILDELAQVDPREAGEIAYMLANGQGKQRSARTGSAKQRQSWRLIFLSSGEIGLAQHMAEGGKKAKAGQEVRMVDIEADAGKGLGLFDTLHGYSDGAKLSDAIKSSAAHHHGHAVLKFAAVLVAAADQLPALIKKEITVFVQTCLPDGQSGGQVHRVCERFGLIAVAGELATANGITGWQLGEALGCVKRCFMEWLASRGGTTNAEPGAMVDAVRSFISKHEEARFTDLEPDQTAAFRPTINRAGWRKNGEHGREYLIDPTAFKSEVCAGFEVNAVCKVLAERGCLEIAVESGKTRYNLKRRIEGVSRRVYVVTSRILEE